MTLLNEKIRDVLGLLETLSEAPASRPPDMATAADLPKDQRVGRDRFSKPAKKHHESIIPTGVSLKDRPPKKDESLYEFWRWRFAQAVAKSESEFDLYRLCLLAERDYAARKFHSPERMALRSGALTDNDAVDGGVAERAAAERVVDLYEGISTAEVAVHEYASVAWVEKARRVHGRNVSDGRPRPAFLGWSEEEREAQVARLRKQGKGSKTIAERFGVDAKTIRKYGRHELAVAA